MWSVISAAVMVAFVLQMVRWLRVLQREQYEPRSIRKFYFRWMSPASASAKALDHARSMTSRLLSTPFAATDRFIDSRRTSNSYRSSPGDRKTAKPISLTMVMFVVFVLALATRADIIGLVVAIVYALVFPWGMPIRGRSQPLQWTRRLVAVTLVTVLISVVVGALIALFRRPLLIGAGELILVPVAIDLAARVTKSFGSSADNGVVESARVKMTRVRPTVVVAAGAFDSRTAVQLLAQILGARSGVHAAPSSSSNHVELARTINQSVVEETRFLLTEWLVVGPRDESRMYSLCPPNLTVISALDPVNLERMKTIEIVEAAVLDIAKNSSAVVLNVDDRRLARWEADLAAAGTTVHRAGTKPGCEVSVKSDGTCWQVRVSDELLAELPVIVGIRETTLACAVAAARALHLSNAEIATRLSQLAAPPSPLVVATLPSGLTVLADTSNVNPSGARDDLTVLRSMAVSGRRVVVTPGMVELGSEQGIENYKLAALAERAGAELVVVARTNAEALLSGFTGRTRRYDTRREAIKWVRSQLGDGDAVLYLNDLPDYYP